MRLTEFFDSGTHGVEFLVFIAKNHSEHVLFEETLTRHEEDSFFNQHFLAEVNVIFDVFKLIDLNLDHHIHRSLGSDWVKAIYLIEDLK